MTEKRKKLVFGIVFSFLFCFLCVGYAQLNDELFINGSVTAGVQDNVFIYEVLDENGNPAEGVSYYGTTLTSTLAPGETVTYTVKFINKNTIYDFYYLETLKDESGETTQNSNITETISGIKKYDIIKQDDGKITGCKITLEAGMSETDLTSVLNFKFVRRNSILKGGEAWYSTSIDKSTITSVEIKSLGEEDSQDTGTGFKWSKNSDGTYTVTFNDEVKTTSATDVWNASVFDDAHANPIAYVENNKLTILGGDALGEIQTEQSLEFAFMNFTNATSMTGFPTLNVHYCTSMLGLFRYNEKVEDINMEGWDTTNLTDMRLMFEDCFTLRSVNLSDFNTSNVTMLNGLFQACKSLEYTYDGNDNSQGIDKVNGINGVKLNFDTTKVKSMLTVFRRCYSVKAIDCSSFTTGDIESYNVDKNYWGIQGMFSHCYNLQYLDISKMTITQKMLQNGSAYSDVFSCYTRTNLENEYENSNESAYGLQVYRTILGTSGTIKAVNLTVKISSNWKKYISAGKAQEARKYGTVTYIN